MNTIKNKAWYYDKLININAFIDSIDVKEKSNLKRFLSDDKFMYHDYVQFLETGIVFIDSINEFSDLYYNYEYFIKSKKSEEDLIKRLREFLINKTEQAYKLDK